MLSLHNPTITSPCCCPKLALLPEVRDFPFFSKFQPKFSVQPGWSASLLAHLLAHGDVLLLRLVPEYLLLKEYPMFPDSFALQDCLPSDSVAKHMLTKEKNGISDHRNSETHVIMKYESLSYLTLSAGNWQNPQKMRRGSSLLDIKKVYAFISCACHLNSINVQKRLKVINQVWYIIIFLHLLFTKYPIALSEHFHSAPSGDNPEYKGNVT